MKIEEMICGLEHSAEFTLRYPREHCVITAARSPVDRDKEQEEGGRSCDDEYRRALDAVRAWDWARNRIGVLLDDEAPRP